MNSPASKADPFAPGKGSLWENMPKSAEEYRKSGGPKTLPAKQNVFGGGGGGYGGGGGGGYGGGYGGGGGGVTAPSPVEFYLGAAPTIQGLDLSGPMSQFRSTFNMMNSGVTPNFEVDTNKVASDAMAVAKKLNLSPEQIKGLIAGINPSTGEIISDVNRISKALNPKSAGQISQEAAEYAGENASKIANQLNAKYQSAFAAAMPGYQQNMAIANKLTTTYLKGQLPPDVVDQVYRGAAAKGFTSGLFGGGIGRNIVARDLGLTSLQLQASGANLLQQTAQIASQVVQSTMPVSGAEFVSGLASGYAANERAFMTDPNQIFSSVMNMKRVDPNTIFNAVYVKPSDVYSQMSSMAQQSTLARAQFEASKMISPERVFDTLVTAAQYNQQIATQNALNAWQSKPLPGQFDIQKGQYVGFEPGTYSSTRPLLPGTTMAAAETAKAASVPDPEGDFMVDMGGAMVPASSLKGPQGQMIVARIRNEMRANAAQQKAQQNQANASWTGSAYRPQIYG